jgi:hypothetical protein
MREMSAPQIMMPPWIEFGTDTPGSSRLWYRRDRMQFDDRRMRGRQSFVRLTVDDEFDPSFFETRFVFPSLWIRVIRTGGLHYRIPFWRGPQPFEYPIESDAAVASLVCDCIARGGYDKKTCDRWQERWDREQALRLS